MTDQTTSPADAPEIRAVYRERAHLIALLAAHYPSTWSIDPAEPDWRVVYITLPTGQASWHIAPSDWDLFWHVHGPASTVWDGHTTGEKYDRVLRATVRQVDAAPAETIEYGIHWRFPQVDHIEPLKGEDDPRRIATVKPGSRHTLVHRYVVRRPDTVGPWIEGEPTAAVERDAAEGLCPSCGGTGHHDAAETVACVTCNGTGSTHPGVALALADWLDTEAQALTDYAIDYGPVEDPDRGPAAHALRIARACLGTDPAVSTEET